MNLCGAKHTFVDQLPEPGVGPSKRRACWPGSRATTKRTQNFCALSCCSRRASSAATSSRSTALKRDVTPEGRLESAKCWCGPQTKSKTGARYLPMRSRSTPVCEPPASLAAPSTTVSLSGFLPNFSITACLHLLTCPTNSLFASSPLTWPASRLYTLTPASFGLSLPICLRSSPFSNSAATISDAIWRMVRLPSAERGLASSST